MRRLKLRAKTKKPNESEYVNLRDNIDMLPSTDGIRILKGKSQPLAVPNKASDEEAAAAEPPRFTEAQRDGWQYTDPPVEEILGIVKKFPSSILEEAMKITSDDRPSAYGSPAENHGKTAAFWSAYLGVQISARQVCMMNILQKISRDTHSPARDNLVDIAGYAQNIEKL